jgi:hypothetical protein
MNLPSVPTRTIHGVPHLECADCGDLQPHYDIVSSADGHFCRRCADARGAEPTLPPTKIEAAGPLRPIHVYVEGINEEAPASAFTRGERWNGWHCPLFTHAQAEVFAAHWNDFVTDDGASATYEAESDEWIFVDNDGNEDTHRGADVIGPDGATLHVYAIGAFGWTWSEAKAEGQVES